ncbi:hypothetical protein [Anaerovibrio lipolyticus]|uniref:hypothetical protein n=1 Tax=Anaerovibrio lipolyticus TaxID=82374 RepID=UPI0026EA18C3|nr:hypothetical protein [Anaerovibrio lipolyticus]MBE6106765.1 hypothetical protein [Anaerovibrio lipolyticus]
MNDMNIKEKSNCEVEDMAVMVISADQLGVVTSMDDAIDMIGESLATPYNVVRLMSGEKKSLLEYAQKVLCYDNVMAMKDGKFNYIYLPKENRLYDRVKTEMDELPIGFHKIL